MNQRRTNHINEPAPVVGASATYASPKGIPFYRRISWGAILAGTLVALVSMLVLNLLGIGIGLGAMNPAGEAQPLAGLSTGAIIWWLVSNLIAVFAGAYVSGRMAGVPITSTSTLHGILSWCLYTLASLWILTTTLGSLMSGVGSIVSDTLTPTYTNTKVAAQHANPAAEKSQEEEILSWHDIKYEVNQVLSNNDANGLATVQEEALKPFSDKNSKNTYQNLSNETYISEEEIEQIAREEFYNGGTLVSNIDRLDLSTSIQQKTNLSPEKSREVANIMVRKYREALREAERDNEVLRQEAEENSQRMAEASSTAAIWAFVALCLGGIMSGLGGRLGKPETVLVSNQGPLKTPNP